MSTQGCTRSRQWRQRDDCSGISSSAIVGTNPAVIDGRPTKPRRMNPAVGACGARSTGLGLRARALWRVVGAAKPVAMDKLTNGEKAMPENNDRSPNAQNPPADNGDERPACAAAPREEAECPLCAGVMRPWAGFYRCPNCGYKESCCF